MLHSVDSFMSEHVINLDDKRKKKYVISLDIFVTFSLPVFFCVNKTFHRIFVDIGENAKVLDFDVNDSVSIDGKKSQTSRPPCSATSSCG